MPFAVADKLQNMIDEMEQSLVKKTAKNIQVSCQCQRQRKSPSGSSVDKSKTPLHERSRSIISVSTPTIKRGRQTSTKETNCCEPSRFCAVSEPNDFKSTRGCSSHCVTGERICRRFDSSPHFREGCRKASGPATALGVVRDENKTGRHFDGLGW